MGCRLRFLILPPFFKPVSLPLLRSLFLSKTPKQVHFLTYINIFGHLFYHTLFSLVYKIYLFILTSKNMFYRYKRLSRSRETSRTFRNVLPQKFNAVRR